MRKSGENVGKTDGGTPREVARRLLAMGERNRLERLTKMVEMISAAITIRSATRAKTTFISRTGGEDVGTKFDRLMEELFGLTFKE